MPRKSVTPPSPLRDVKPLFSCKWSAPGMDPCNLSKPSRVMSLSQLRIKMVPTSVTFSKPCKDDKTLFPTKRKPPFRSPLKPWKPPTEKREKQFSMTMLYPSVSGPMRETSSRPSRVSNRRQSLILRLPIKRPRNCEPRNERKESQCSMFKLTWFLHS